MGNQNTKMLPALPPVQPDLSPVQPALLPVLPALPPVQPDLSPVLPALPPVQPDLSPVLPALLPVLPALLPVRTVTGRGFARGPRGIRRELVVKLKVKKFIFMQFSLNNKRRDTLNNRIQVIIFTAYRTYLLYFSIYM